ncbi:Isochorismatase hydrolase [Thelephora terrestris]|uniref:Isochorismatase hydrolase n=1 Tax=Thelephora terrestris TaxID=56493 RepID=A0A9P6L281_9AGAM|nr:Isochorismatase hydrolase [Thelephora terrestris]
MSANIRRLDPKKTVLLVCDIQVKFRDAIYGFEEVVATTTKMLKIAKILEVPVIVSEQYPKGLGATVPELNVNELGPLHLGTFDKTLFSMVVPPVEAILKQHDFESVLIVGIEVREISMRRSIPRRSLVTHVHVLADGVSSVNKEEVPIALASMRQAGARITTSESCSFQLMGEASGPKFKVFSALVKAELNSTRASVSKLLPYKSAL